MKELLQSFLMPNGHQEETYNSSANDNLISSDCCQEVDRFFLFKNIEELARLHTICFNSSSIWRESWVDFPTKGREDSLGYLLRLAAFDTRFFVRIDEDGTILGRPGKIVGCGVMESLSKERLEYFELDKLGGRIGDCYNNVMFAHPDSHGRGVASNLIDLRLKSAFTFRCSPKPRYFVRTRSDHDKLIEMYKKRGFRVSGSQVIEEAGQRSERFILSRPMPYQESEPLHSNGSSQTLRWHDSMSTF